MTFLETRVQALKAERGEGPVEGTATPVGVSSGDESEAAQWNEEDAPRVKEEDEQEDLNSPLAGLRT